MLDSLIRDQCGVLTRAQAKRCGLSDGALAARVASGRWRRLFGPVYATFSGPVPRTALLWAAVLRCGPGAVLSHATAAELWGLDTVVRQVVHVSVPWRRRVAPLPGLRVWRRVTMPPGRGSPPRTPVEDTVIDLTQVAGSVDAAAAWVARACGSRLTTAARLERVIAGRPKLRWRSELAAAVTDVGLGCHSALELRYLRDVERAHGLPVGLRQVRALDGYQDVRYGEVVVVELDGQLGHLGDGVLRDLRRDNSAAVAGLTTLRYGWADVTGRPCAVAEQVASVLRRAGWTGTVRRCPVCPP